MVLITLLETFGIEKARDYMQHNLIPYFLACGVSVEGLSWAAGQPAEVDDPHALTLARRTLSGNLPVQFGEQMLA